MKCHIMWHFIRVYNVCYGKKDHRQKIQFFFNYNLTPLDIYNGLSQFIVSNQKEESIQRAKLESKDN